jgi:hypothetical protein
LPPRGDGDFADCHLQNRTLCRGRQVLSSLQRKPEQLMQMQRSLSRIDSQPGSLSIYICIRSKWYDFIDLIKNNQSRGDVHVVSVFCPPIQPASGNARAVVDSADHVEIDQPLAGWGAAPPNRQIWPKRGRSSFVQTRDCCHHHGSTGALGFRLRNDGLCRPSGKFSLHHV